jgi:hypothetical protein
MMLQRSSPSDPSSTSSGANRCYRRKGQSSQQTSKRIWAGEKAWTNLVSLDKGLERLGGDLLALLLSTNEPLKVVAQSPRLPDLAVKVPLVSKVGDHASNVLEDVGKDRVVRHGLGEGEFGDLGGEVGDGEGREEGVEGVDGSSGDVSRGRGLGGGGSSGLLEGLLGGLGESSDLMGETKRNGKKVSSSSVEAEERERRANLGEGGTLSNVSDTGNENTKVGSSDSRVSDELDQVGDDDAGHSGRVGGSLLEGSDEEGDHDGEDGSVDLGDKGGGREGLDGSGDGGGGSHGVDELVGVRLQVRVVERLGQVSSGLLGSGSDLRIQRKW